MPLLVGSKGAFGHSLVVDRFPRASYAPRSLYSSMFGLGLKGDFWDIEWGAIEKIY